MQRRTAPLFATVVFAATLVTHAIGIPFLKPSVTTEYDHSNQFSGRTYSWADARMPVASYVDPVKAMIDENLKKKGWQLVPSGGSATVFVLGDTLDAGHVADYYAAHGGGWSQEWGWQGWGPGWKPTYGVATFNALGTPESHLLLDVFDSGTHRLMFRGVAGEDLSNSQKKNTKKLSKTVKQIFKSFPKK